MPARRDPGLVAFGRIVRKIRRDRELSQDAVAQRAGLHPSEISFIEGARRDIKVTTMLKLMRALDMTPGEVWTVYDEQTDEPTATE